MRSPCFDMRRLVFILTLACCITAFGQAFTPRRPFVFQSTTITNNDPTNIPGLYMWFKSASFTNDGPINLWTDVISGFVFTQTLAALQPIKTNTGVWFTGTRNFMTNDVAKVAGYHYVIFKRDSNGGQNTYAASVTPVTDVNYNLYHPGVPTGSYWVRCLNACANEYFSSETYTNAMSDFYAGTQEYTNGVLATAFGGPAPTVSLGGIGGGSALDCFHGYLYDLFIFTNDLSAANVATMHYYATNTYWTLYQNYTAPTISAQPSSIACLTNTIQSFTVSATGTPAPSYYWRTNAVNLSDGNHWQGVSTTNLWVTNDTTLFTNLEITCMASNVMGTATSSIAYLTVMDNAVTNGLVGWWRFDEGSGTSTADSTGLGNAGNLTNSPGWVTGKYTNGIYFPYAATAGAASFVRVTNAASLNTFSAISLAGWVYITNAAADVGSIIIKKTTADVAAAPADPYALYEMKISTTQLYGGVSTGGAGTRRSATLVTTTSQNEWHHCVMTYDGANLKLYKDMVILTNYNAGAIAIGSNVFPVSLGASVYSSAVQPLVGLGDDFRIYNRALNTNEINALYQWTGPQQ